MESGATAGTQRGNARFYVQVLGARRLLMRGVVILDMQCLFGMMQRRFGLFENRCGMLRRPCGHGGLARLTRIRHLLHRRTGTSRHDQRQQEQECYLTYGQLLLHRYD